MGIFPALGSFLIVDQGKGRHQPCWMFQLRQVRKLPAQWNFRVLKCRAVEGMRQRMSEPTAHDVELKWSIGMQNPLLACQAEQVRKMLTQRTLMAGSSKGVKEMLKRVLLPRVPQMVTSEVQARVLAFQDIPTPPAALSGCYIEVMWGSATWRRAL